MTPIGNVLTEGDSVISHVSRRSYPFTLLPLQKVQTFTTPSIILTPPTVRFINGATVESNKLYEASIEQAYNSGEGNFFPYGPDESKGHNYITSFDCIMAILGITPANLDNTGFIGIELFSQNASTLTNTPANGCIQLKWQLKDPTQWMLSTYLGDSIPGIHQSFSIPSFQALGGHKVRLLWNPFELSVSAYVDDVLMAKQAIEGILPYADFSFVTQTGILITNGNITANPAIIATWMGAEICTHGLNAQGAGRF